MSSVEMQKEIIHNYSTFLFQGTYHLSMIPTDTVACGEMEHVVMTHYHDSHIDILKVRIRGHIECKYMYVH